MVFTSPDPEPQEELSPAQERVLKKVRRFSLVSGLIMMLGVACVFGVIGYRMLRAKGQKASDITAALPKGARIVATAVADKLLVVTLDVGGAVEVRTFDLDTLAPAGRLRFAVEP